LHHFQAQFGIGDGLIAVRRIARREKADFLEAQGLL
jgi:hypothetical protein